jgi:hypothetical protein
VCASATGCRKSVWWGVCSPRPPFQRLAADGQTPCGCWPMRPGVGPVPGRMDGSLVYVHACLQGVCCGCWGYWWVTQQLVEPVCSAATLHSPMQRDLVQGPCVVQTHNRGGWQGALPFLPVVVALTAWGVCDAVPSFCNGHTPCPRPLGQSYVCSGRHMDSMWLRAACWCHRHLVGSLPLILGGGSSKCGRCSFVSACTRSRPCF